MSGKKVFNWCVQVNREADIKAHLEVEGFMFITNRRVCSRPSNFLTKLLGIDLVQSHGKWLQITQLLTMLELSVPAAEKVG